MANCLHNGIHMGFGALGFSLAAVKERAFFWRQIANIGVIFIPITFYHFIYAYLKLDKNYQKIYCILFIFAELFFYSNFFAPKWVFTGDVRFVFNQFTIPIVAIS